MKEKCYKRGISLALSVVLLAGTACSNTKTNTSTAESKRFEFTTTSESISEGGMENKTEITSESTREGQTSSISETTTASEEKANPYAIEIPQATVWTKDYDNEAFNIKGVEEVRTIGLVTGDGSENQTRTRFKVGGTDLGIPVYHKDKLYLWFGDTFWGDKNGHPMQGGLWRSNVLALSEDKDFSDGLRIDDMITKGKGNTATELLSSKKIPGTEHTVIPTGSVSVNGKLYVYFMSVKEWGKPGEWVLNYGGLAVSEDDGQSFTKIEGFELDPDRFGQFAAGVVDDYVYGVGIGGGRRGDAYLARVPLADIENIDAYSYFTGMDGDEPVFSGNVKEATKIIDRQVGEPSFMYNDYLQEYVVTYLDEPEHAIVMRTAKELWGPYSDELIIGSSADFPAMYGGFVHPLMTEEDGKVFYYMMSMWDPVYNSILMQVRLK